MKLSRLILNNFLSFGTNVVIDLSTVKPPVLVQGVTKSAASSNGAGKSSLFEAFYWCCTGKLIRDVSAAEVIRLGEKMCSVGADFEYNGKAFQVTREYSASKKRVQISVNGSLEEFHDSKQGNERLFELLGITPEILSLVCFSGRKFQTFSKLKPSARADLIDMLAQGTKWDEAKALEVRRAKDIAKDMDHLGVLKTNSTNELNKHSTQIENTAGKLGREKTEQESKLASISADIFKAEELLQGKQVTLDSIAKNLGSTAEPIEIMQAVNDVAQEIVQTSTNLNTMKTSAQNLVTAVSLNPNVENDKGIWSWDSELKQATKNKAAEELRVSRLKFDPARWDNEKNKLANELETGLCSSCGQKLPHTHDETKTIDRLADIEEEILAAKAAFEEDIKAGFTLIASYITSIDDLSKKIDDRKVELQALFDADKITKQAALDELTNKIIVEQATLDEFRSYQAELSTQATEASKARREYQEQFTRISLEVSQATNYLNSLKVQLSTIQGSTTLAVLEREMELLKGRVQEESGKLEAFNADLIKLSTKLTLAKYWAQGFADIRFSLFNGVVKALEDLLNAFCSQQGLDFEKIEIDTWKVKADNKTKPEINLYVVRDGKSLSIDALSQGEAQRVDLACFFAMRALVQQSMGFALDLAVLDEPLDGIDTDGKHMVFGIIDSMSEKSQVFVIDHDSNFKSLFTNTITVSKDVTSTVSIT